MYRSAPAFALSLLTLAASTSESQAIKIHMHDAGGYAADGMLYKPPGQPPFAALVLIPDTDGLTMRVQQAAQRFAAAGYFTLAVDPNRGMPGELAQISDEEKQHDVKAALAFIDAQTDIQPGQVAAVGWGVGARFAIRLTRESKLKAVMLQDPKLALIGADGGTQVPTLVSIAGKDPSASSQSITALKRQLHKSAPEVKIYLEAQSGFDDPSDSAHFRISDAQDLHQRQLKFLASHLTIKP